MFFFYQRSYLCSRSIDSIKNSTKAERDADREFKYTFYNNGFSFKVKERSFGRLAIDIKNLQKMFAFS